jgi:hypothetical protein
VLNGIISLLTVDDETGNDEGESVLGVLYLLPTFLWKE